MKGGPGGVSLYMAAHVCQVVSGGPCVSGSVRRPRRRQVVQGGGPGGVRLSLTAHVFQVVSGGPGGGSPVEKLTADVV